MPINNIFFTFATIIIIIGKRPTIPAESSASLKSLIECCWHQEPQQRWTMDKVVNELKKMNGKERERKKENRKIEID
jgi:hypothetical protein